MPGRRCPGRNCPTILTNGERYCPAHAAEYETKRGTPERRGYGARHKATRAAIVARINAGQVITCVDCGERLTPGTLDLGHTEDRTAYKGPQCAPCNRSDGGRRGRAMQTP